MPALYSHPPTGTEIAKRAWNSAFAAMRAMPMLFGSAALGAVFAAAIIAGLSYLAQPLPTEALVNLVNILAVSALGAPVAVAMHRFILLDQLSPDLLSYAPAHTRVFFVWLLIFQVAASILSAIGSVFFLLRIATFLIILIGSVDLAMIFPAIATDVPAADWQGRLRQSWERMQGHFWLFIRASIVTFLPALGIFLLVIGAATLMGLLARALIFPAWFVGLWAVIAIGPMMIAFIALGAAVASWMYLWTGESQAQSAQTATSTVT